MIKPCHPCQKTRIMIQEIERRRTFAIISHPDAGKTTLTEKFLLFGGQIQVAGAVKNNKIKKTATSDWMDIEKQRGISVSTSVMEFDYTPTSPSPSQGGESDSSPSGRLGEVYKVNILDTPGHQDFAEDTYRTLTAVDSAIIVVDGAKGVETQTRKLMNVCRMRNTPVIIFINKMDREGRDPFDLLDELEQELEIKVRPLSWPINQGAKFKGVYNIYEEKLDLFTPDKQRVTEKVEVDINSADLDNFVGEQDAAKLRDDLELIDGVYPDFDVETYRSAEVAPVFFGSALNNFGVQELLNCFVEIAPSPKETKTSTPTIARASPSARCAAVSSSATSPIFMCVRARPCVSRRPHNSWLSARAPSTRRGQETSWDSPTTASSRLATRSPRASSCISADSHRSLPRCSSTSRMTTR